MFNTDKPKLPSSNVARKQGATKLLVAVFVCVLILNWSSQLRGQSWVTAKSTYTHDPETCQRVNQYLNVDRVVHTPSPTRSVYRHTRSSLQVGDSIDQYHVVEQYGAPVRPYGEWRFPYRPFSVPYSKWGPNPNFYGPGFGPGYGGGFGGGYGGGFVPPAFGGGGIGSPYGPYGVINGAGFPPQWMDGYYPDVRRNLLPPQPAPNFGPQFQNNVQGNNNTINQ